LAIGKWEWNGPLSFDHQAYADKKQKIQFLITMLKLKMAETNKVPTLGLGGIIENGHLNR
jgi:hypothetical protein